MSVKKIIMSVLVAAIIPFGVQVNATNPKKNNTYKKTAAKPSNAAAASKTVAMEKAAENDNASAVNSEDVSGETIVKTAMRFIGVPYRRGSSSPRSFDCSGFTSYVFKQFDIALNRDSRSQYTQGKVIKNKSDLRAGDLVFFRGSSGRGGVGHVGIVTEVSPKDKTFKFVHASSSKGVTTEQSTTAYYSSRYIGARRVLQSEEE